jgi:transcriptional regulator with XRE-family HTH domain
MELYNDDDRLSPKTLLSVRMRRMRQDEGLSLRGLADAIRLPFGFLGRVERGEQDASETLVRALDRRWATDGLFVALLELAQEDTIADYSRDFLRRERDTIGIQVFTSSLIPGLLQSADYARELFRISQPGVPPERIEVQVAARMKRQRIFERQDPPYYWAIMDEAALKRPTASRRTMREQIAHIMRSMTKPHVTVQVLPFDRGLHPMLGGSLNLFTMKDGSRIALVEGFDSALRVDSPKGIVRQVQFFERACAMALPEDESLALIHEYLKGYDDGRDS